MASEKQVNILMQLLDEALSDVDTIEGKLSSYEEMLQSVKEQMDQISQSNRLIQISNTNNGKLLDEIQFLVVSIVVDVGGGFLLLLVCLDEWFASIWYDYNAVPQDMARFL